jgi:outer membrane protein TolC
VGRLAELDGREASLRAGLTALLHGAPFTQPTPPPTTPPRELPIFREPLDTRPDIRALTSEVKSALHLAESAEAARQPDLTLIGGLRWNSGFDADGDTTAELGLKLTWPAYDGGQRAARERAARHQSQAKRLELAGALDAANGAVLSAEASWHAASAGYTAALSGLEAATEAARVQRERFAVGRLSSTDLLDAEARLAEAQDNLSRTLSSWWRANDALLLAHGQDPRGTTSL